MDKQKRVWMAVAALLLVGLYFFPIWSIALEAPQYPEGIGLNISINNVEGKAPNDLQNINNLNHYIGMQEIQPDSIPELIYMPYIVGFLIVTGLLVALFGNRSWIAAWIVIFVLLAAAGIYDFYLWEYDYGHNLDPNAPIKIPGMSYQPPLLGSEKIVNFTATSLPHIGSFFVFASMVLSGWVWWSSGGKDS
jgi:hypothetical protein